MTRSEELLGGAVLTCGVVPVLAAVLAVMVAGDVPLGWAAWLATGPLLPFSFGSLITQDGRDALTRHTRGVGRVRALVFGMWAHPVDRTRRAHRASVIGTLVGFGYLLTATF